jgi:EpsI family protein
LTKMTDNLGPQGATTNPVVPDKRFSHIYYVLPAIALLLIFSHFNWTLSKVRPKPLLKSFDSFPLQLGGWQGQSSKIEEDIFIATGAETYFNADYADPQRNLVNLWIAYYGRHSHGVDLGHRPEYCMVGSGWRIVDSQVQYVADGLPVNALIMEKGGGRALVYYWHIQQGRWLANRGTYKFYMGLSSLVQKRTDWALIRLITPVKSDIQAATEHLNSFARLLIPVIPQFIQK